MKTVNDIKFATAINCIDGRVQLPVIEWMRKKYKVDYVDMITEPGPDKILAENKETILIESIKRKLKISITKHNSKLVAIIGHYDCAANPVEKEVHLNQIWKSIELVKSWDLGIKIVGLYIDENWKVKEI
jgi:hypothetical protein